MSLFFRAIIKSKKIKKIIIVIIVPFIILSLIDYLKSQGGFFSFVPLIVECLIFLCYIMYFFYEKMQSIVPSPIYQTSSFWIVVAFTLYCAGNFFLFLYSNNTVKDDSYKLQYTIIYSTFTILKNIFICIGLTVKQSKEYADSSTLNTPDEWEIPAEYKKINPNN